MTDRIPVEGITIDAEPDECGHYVLRGPNGELLAWCTTSVLDYCGIPVPTPPFKDPLNIGLTEFECDWCVETERNRPDGTPSGLFSKIGRALLAAGYVPRAER